MKDLLLVLGLVFGWIVLSRWVLPWLGVPTCMSGCCQESRCASAPASAAAAREDSAPMGGPAEVVPPDDAQSGTHPAGAESAGSPAAPR